MRSSVFHWIATLIWTLLVVPTLLWWHDSVIWIALMSIWANVVSHATAYEAAKAKEATRRDAGTDAA